MLSQLTYSDHLTKKKSAAEFGSYVIYFSYSIGYQITGRDIPMSWPYFLTLSASFFDNATEMQIVY